MLLEKLPGEALLEMQQESGNICVSILIPTHRLSPERRIDKLALESAIEAASLQLRNKYPAAVSRPILNDMNDLFEHMDFTHSTEGLGLFISPIRKMVVRFPFAVEEKVMVGDHFEIRDLLYNMHKTQPYLVMLISEKEIKLMEGTWNNLKEISDEHFPKTYQESYLYNPPDRGTSYAGQPNLKGYEKDKSELEAIRFKDFFRSADEQLKRFVKSKMPIILMGSEKELGWYEKVTAHQQYIIAKIQGNYNTFNPKAIADLVWPKMQAYQQQEEEKLIRLFAEKIGEHLGISGIQEVWQAVKEGKALTLLVEKDFHSEAYTANDNYLLYLYPPIAPHKAIPDAVDEIIEMVLQSGGKVFFTQNEALKQYNRIALITRY